MKEFVFSLAMAMALGGSVSRADGGTSTTQPEVSVNAPDPVAFGALSTGAVVVSRNGSSGDLTVNLTYSGSASNGVDYVTLPASVNIPDGSRAVGLVVQPINGGDITHTKVVDVGITTSTNYHIGRDHATVQLKPNAFEDAPPSVTITAPADNTSIVAKSDLTITATATDDKGNPKVSFFANDHLLGSVTAPPYTLVWSNVPAGKFALFARAEDAFGKSAVSSPAHVTATNPPVATGILKLIAPLSGARFGAGANIDVSASVSGNSNVTSVAFTANGKAIGSANAAPYTITWSNVLAGTYLLRASATDSLGGLLTSGFVEIHVTNKPVTVSITAPTAGTTVAAGSNVEVDATASSPNGDVKNVMVFLDSYFVGKATTAPFTFTITNVPPGMHKLRAAATDVVGAVGYSEPVSLTVTNPPGSISITSPTNNTTVKVGTAINLAVDATDPNGIRAVVIYEDGHIVKVTDHSPYAAVVSSSSIGTHVFVAEEYDLFGGKTRSEPVTVTVTAQ